MVLLRFFFRVCFSSTKYSYYPFLIKGDGLLEHDTRVIREFSTGLTLSPCPDSGLDQVWVDHVQCRVLDTTFHVLGQIFDRSYSILTTVISAISGR